jgi:hypothetical protein
MFGSQLAGLLGLPTSSNISITRALDRSHLCSGFHPRTSLVGDGITLFGVRKIHDKDWGRDGGRDEGRDGDGDGDGEKMVGTESMVDYFMAGKTGVSRSHSGNPDETPVLRLSIFLGVR